MRTYKLFRIRDGKLYPLYVGSRREMPIGQWLEARVGELADEGHVKSRIGPLALRPGFHSTRVPFADWIGKWQGGCLVQRKNTVWCECEVEGEEVQAPKKGLRTIPDGWYEFRTKPDQPFPWIISDRILIKRMLSHDEVERICSENGVVAQRMEENTYGNCYEQDLCGLWPER